METLLAYLPAGMSAFDALCLFLLIALSGLVDSIAGGGGLISIPTYLSYPIPSAFVLGTNKCVSTTGGIIANIRYIRSGQIDWRAQRLGIPLSFLGAIIGTLLSHHLDSRSMFYLLLLVIPLVLIAKGRRRKGPVGPEIQYVRTRQEFAKVGIMAASMGLYDGFFGPGTGVFLLLGMQSWLGYSWGKAGANARILNFTSNLISFLIFMYQGKILWAIAFLGISGSVIGNFIGSGLAVKGAEKVVKPVFYTVLFLLLMKCLHTLL